MAQIMRVPLFRHLRAEPSAHVLHYHKGRLRRSGRGLSFWYRPLVSGLAEIPLDDREQSFLFTGRSLDFQDVTVQGAVTYRVAKPEELAKRLDFSIDVDRGMYLRKPFEQLTGIMAQLAQQVALDFMAHQPLRTVLQEGVQSLRDRIDQFLRGSGELPGMGIELVSVRVAKVSPTSELEKALQAPTRETIQQTADEAVFQRRAQAVDKERAIAENELQNKIELARRAEALIRQEGANEVHRHEELSAALRIEASAAADTAKVKADGDAAVIRSKAAARAEAIDQVHGARNRAEAVHLDAYGRLPAAIVFGLAMRELAGRLQKIDHLNLAPDAFGPLLQELLSAGTKRLEGGAGK
jgi:regulator of protease activity HflC (stomatin/prohibitin superfamily)